MIRFGSGLFAPAYIVFLVLILRVVLVWFLPHDLSVARGRGFPVAKSNRFPGFSGCRIYRFTPWFRVRHLSGF